MKTKFREETCKKKLNYDDYEVLPCVSFWEKVQSLAPDKPLAQAFIEDLRDALDAGTFDPMRLTVLK